MKQIARSYVWWLKIDADLEAVLSHVRLVKRYGIPLHLPHFTLGFGPQNHGYEYKLILPDVFEQMFLWSLMLTQNGQK